jgi:lactoylglutathione lyase
MEAQIKTAVVILAAGQGKRMKNPDLPKVLVSLAEKPLLGHVLDKVESLDPDKTIIVIGHKREKVRDFCNRHYEWCEFAIQEEQLGTGHAVDQARDELLDFDGNVLILAGDVPLLTFETISKFIQHHKDNNSVLSVLSTSAPDPTGYGRIVRNENGDFINITEHKDATDEIRKINEINSGVFLVDSKILFTSLSEVNNENAQGEYYLTDIVDIVRNKDMQVHAFNVADFDELQGVNSPEDLKKAENTYYRSIVKQNGNEAMRPFKVLGIQQIAIGGEDKSKLKNFWVDKMGLNFKHNFKSEKENVNEDILSIGHGATEVEVDIMEPIDIEKKPKVHIPALNHIGLWIDDLQACVDWLTEQGVRFTPGGIRKGAAGFDVCFIHPKGNEEFPLSSEGVLVELVQAPEEVIKELS